MLHSISRILLSGALLWPNLGCEAADLPEEGPWSDAWPMPLRGEERIFVVHDERDYLWAQPTDFSDPASLDGLEVAYLAKFSRRQGDQPTFYGLESVQVVTDDPSLAAATDGENFYLFGTIAHDKGRTVYRIRHVAAAPSDADVIANRLASLPEQDWEGRLAVAQWVAEQGEEQGNRAFWSEAAQTLRHKIVRAASAQAADQQDVDLLLRAMEWAITIAGSRDLAADIASKAWVFDLPEDQLERVSSRMRELDYVLYQTGGDRMWMTQSGYLEKTFEVRFAAIKWGDAESAYELGLWAEEHGDVLPHASQLSHKAFQAGHRMDPKHNGIRRMLKLDLVSDGSDGRTESGRRVDPPFTSADTLVELDGPSGWTRNQPPVISDADASWTTRTMPTTYLAISARQFTGSADPQSHWSDLIASISALPNAEVGQDWRTDIGDRQIRRVRFSFTSNGNERQGQVALIHDSSTGRSAALRIVYEEPNEAESLAAFEDRLAAVTFNPLPEPTPREQPDDPAPPAQPGPRPDRSAP